MLQWTERVTVVLLGTQIEPEDGFYPNMSQYTHRSVQMFKVLFATSPVVVDVE